MAGGLKELDCVRTLVDIQRDSSDGMLVATIPAGTLGTVVHDFGDGSLQVIVEFLDRDGYTLATPIVPVDELERVPSELTR